MFVIVVESKMKYLLFAGCFLFFGEQLNSFAVPPYFGSLQNRQGLSSKLPASLSTDVEVKSPPSWEDLESQLPETSQEEPVLTLYRDTNGWCPFCERVWVAIRVKGLPYRESLVSLQNKPEWYKQLVPTALVPAVLFHGSNDTTDRTVVWESLSILQQLDDLFPDTPRLLYQDNPNFEAAMEMNNRVQTAGFQFAYGGRNQTLSKEDKMERRRKFEEALNELDAALGQQDGPFCLGKEFTGMDAIMIPTMERWRYQLPITAEFDILKNRKNLQKWFDAMDSFAPYSERVAGDEYSWTATTSMFLRYFGGGEDKPEVAAGIARADAAAEKLSATFANAPRYKSAFALEAATKLISNHEAVVTDCTRQDPQSQQHIPRATNKEAADAVLRHVSFILISCLNAPIEMAQTCPLVEISDPVQGALAARTVAKRLCVPRDMSGPAAATLRGVLSIVADRLEGSS